MSDDYGSETVEGVGEIYGRRGTSTLELAGAARYWHNKFKTARYNGICLGFLLGSIFASVAFYTTETVKHAYQESHSHSGKVGR